MDIAVFVINLKRSKDRKDHTVKKLNDLCIPFTFIEAIDGNDLADKDLLNNNRYGIYKSGLYSRYLLKGEIGCTLSHLKIYRKMADEKIALACILEDDNNYAPEFKNLIFETDLHSDDWDILYLGHHPGSPQRKTRTRKKTRLETSDYWIGDPLTKHYGSYAYLINNKAAAILADNLFPINLPFDRFMIRAVHSGLRTSVIIPPCVSPETGFKSTVNDNPVVVYPHPFWQITGRLLRKMYFIFPLMQKFRKQI
jgi:glycosyl transferase family 25